MENFLMPPVPPPFASSTSLVDISADMTQSLRDKLFFLLKIKYQEQNDDKLKKILNSLILEIITQNSQEIIKYLVLYPQMLKITFRAFICKYFVSDVDQIDKNLRNIQYMSIYNTTCPQFTNYLLKEVHKQHIMNSNLASTSSYFSASSLDDTTTLYEIETVSDSKEPLTKRRKTVRFSDDNTYSKLYMLAEVSLQNS
jgi:hypothetical protein